MPFMLADLDFGRDDAETDIANGLLREGFLETYAYAQVRATAENLTVVGRKGSGKSAICRTIAAGSGATSVITPDELSSKQVREFSLNGIGSDMAKTLMWRYILAVRVGLHLVEHAKAGHAKPPKSVGALIQFLKDNGELHPVKAPRFSDVLARLKTSLKLDALGASVAVEVAGQPVDKPAGLHVADQVETVEQHLGKVITDLACPAGHPRLLLLVDQIEDVWETNDAGLSDALVIGLLKAAKKVEATYPRVTCVVFLRSDIYDLLSFTDKDKYHGGELRLGWSADQLRELALRRARASLGADLPEHVLWGELFRPYDHKRHISEVLVEHTLLRPRDIIHLCNLCRKTALSHGHDRIEPGDVHAALDIYSKWKLDDLKTEYSLGYPYLGPVLAAFKDHGFIVTRKALKQMLPPDALAALRQDYPRQADELTHEGILDTLYDIGFLGIRHNDTVTYAKGDGESVEPRDAEFHIHPCFRRALNANQAAISTPYRSAVELKRLAKPRGRDSRQYQVAVSARRLVDGLTQAVQRSGLPPQVTAEVQSALANMLRLLTQAREVPEEQVTALLLDVQAYLRRLGLQLRDRGFTDENDDLDRRFGTTADQMSFHTLATEVDRVVSQVGRDVTVNVRQGGGVGSDD